MRKIRQIARKEFRHILRDPRSLIIAILMPVMMTFLYGYAINLDIKNIKLAIKDFDNTSVSRELAGKFYNSGYFIRAEAEPDISDPEEIFRRGEAVAVLVIRNGFGKTIDALKYNPQMALNSDSPFQVGLFLDGADANTAAAAASYSSIIVTEFMKRALPPDFEFPGVRIASQVLYNPDLKSSHFFVPGLIAIILMMISALLTSITIAREKETGTMEQLLTSPVTPRQIIIGKVIPYVFVALLDGVLVLAFGVFHFGVPFSGSVAALFLFGVIYIVAALSIGILISTLVSTQQLAMMGALLATVLPSVMLSGFIFDLKNTPVVLQALSHIVPARYFIAIIRGIMLKGADIGTLWLDAGALLCMSLILLGLAAKRFKMRIG